MLQRNVVKAYRNSMHALGSIPIYKMSYQSQRTAGYLWYCSILTDGNNSPYLYGIASVFQMSSKGYGLYILGGNRTASTFRVTNETRRFLANILSSVKTLNSALSNQLGK